MPMRASWPLAAALFIIALLLLPLDGAVSSFVTRFRPGGDLRRELEMVQQFGGATSIAIAGLLIWRLDPRRLVLMLDWLAAAGATWLAVFTIKIAAARPRPKFVGEHLHFLWPWGSRIVHEGDPPRHAWEIFAEDVAELWSMPSSHTAFAVVAAVCLGHMYPRLRTPALCLCVIVGACRVLFKAHYPSDVLIGAAIGYVIAQACMQSALGRRLARVTGPPTIAR